MKKPKTTKVAIIMGSDSDLEVMRECIPPLREFGIAHEVTIVSAHRTPARLVSYCRRLAPRGFRVIIAGAGGAAHLPGMAASLSPLPVIGVPIKSRTSLEGLDSLLSIVQMPPGVPVATVAINGARNAGILAVQILAAGDESLIRRMDAYKKTMSDQVLEKVRTLDRLGVEEYIKQKR